MSIKNRIRVAATAEVTSVLVVVGAEAASAGLRINNGGVMSIKNKTRLTATALVTSGLVIAVAHAASAGLKWR